MSLKIMTYYRIFQFKYKYIVKIDIFYYFLLQQQNVTYFIIEVDATERYIADYFIIEVDTTERYIAED